MSPAVKNVLACSNRDGETVEGNVVDSLAPEVVMARLMSGTASSMRSRSVLISFMTEFISASSCTRRLAEAPFP